MMSTFRRCDHCAAEIPDEAKTLRVTVDQVYGYKTVILHFHVEEAARVVEALQDLTNFDETKRRLGEMLPKED